MKKQVIALVVLFSMVSSTISRSSLSDKTKEIDRFWQCRPGGAHPFWCTNAQKEKSKKWFARTDAGKIVEDLKSADVSTTEPPQATVPTFETVISIKNEIKTINQLALLWRVIDKNNKELIANSKKLDAITKKEAWLNPQFNALLLKLPGIITKITNTAPRVQRLISPALQDPEHYTKRLDVELNTMAQTIWRIREQLHRARGRIKEAQAAEDSDQNRMKLGQLERKVTTLYNFLEGIYY